MYKISLYLNLNQYLVNYGLIIDILEMSPKGMFKPNEWTNKIRFKYHGTWTPGVYS